MRNRFGVPERVVLYIRAKPGERDACFKQSEAILRLLRKLPPGAEDDFALSTADQIIATFDGLSARIGLVTVALAGVSLLIGAIGIANVMFISVTERTREIGLRLAVGARRGQVLVQFLLEAAFLSSIGGVAGVGVALGIGLLLTLRRQRLLRGRAALGDDRRRRRVGRRRHRRRLLARPAGGRPGSGRSAAPRIAYNPRSVI